MQAAFVEYGGNRQGFLAFSEVHPDYYRIPVEDREALIEAENAENAEDESEAEADGAPETVGGDGQDDNPFCWEDVCKNIDENLSKDGFERGKDYEIMLVPNITNICYGRGVGYKIEEIVLPEEIQKISATKIRAKMREEGKLK